MEEIKREAFRIKQAEFITSVGGTDYPGRLNVEIAIAGRSNAGKSSLINAICNNNKLAKVSQSPGKTRLINFFLINREFYIVDLPGYGFAKASKTERASWGALIESYLNARRVTHTFLLTDIRHAPTLEDKEMFRWLLYAGAPFTLIATKADKVVRSKRRQMAEANARALGAPPDAIPFSSVEPGGRDGLLTRIGQIVADSCLIQE